MRRVGSWLAKLSASLLLASAPAASFALAAESGPQAVVRQFCQADGLGLRVSVLDWPGVAPLVAWAFEPAWDHAVLIGGYEVGAPHAGDAGSSSVEVRYTVIGEVSALGLETDTHQETITFRLDATAGAWRIGGPPPAPHIFATGVDVDQMRRSFERGGVNFIANTSFVWQMFRTAGWNVPFERTADLLNGAAYRVVEQPKAGDVVVYLRDGTPYHAGVLEADNQVVSSTVNAGIVRTATDAFPGEVTYMRLLQPEPTIARSAPSGPAQHAGVLPPVPARRPQPLRTPSPALTKGKQLPKKAKTQPKAARRQTPQPSKSRRVKPVGQRSAAPQPTPVAADANP